MPHPRSHLSLTFTVRFLTSAFCSWLQTCVIRNLGRMRPHLALNFILISIIYVKYREVPFLVGCQTAKAFKDESEAPIRITKDKEPE